MATTFAGEDVSGDRKNSENFEGMVSTDGKFYLKNAPPGKGH